jgi:hypothetical protein
MQYSPNPRSSAKRHHARPDRVANGLGVMLRRIIFSVAAASFVQSADAGPIDDKVFAEFESLCLDNMNEIGRASFFADATGMVEDRGTIAKTFLDGHAGRVWLKQEADTRYALILTDEGSCGIAGPDADGPEVLKLVLGNLRNRHLETSNQGSTVLAIFAVTQAKSAWP